MNDISEFDNIDMDVLCSGCLIYEKHLEKPKNNYKCIGYIIKDTGCPCIDCLIKMMCFIACDKIEARKWPAKYRRT